MEKELTQSLEKYLLAVYNIIEQNGAARIRDVSEKMNIGAASTSEAIKNLAKKNFIKYKPYGIITLTEKGGNTAIEKLKRRETIAKFLNNILKINNEKIEKYTTDIEFSMPDEVLTRFIEYLNFMEKCSCKEPKWIKSFQDFVINGKMNDKCIECAKNKDEFDNTKCCHCP